MTEGQPTEINRQPEKVAPLTITLSETAQRGVLQNLMISLVADTNAETRERFKDRPDVIAEIDATRNVTTQIAQNLRKEIDPLTALNLGLTDLLPPGQLEQWAHMDKGEASIQAKAQYFLDKKPPQAKP
jgi:hypothetical protein